MHRRRFLATAALAVAPNILTASKTAEPPVIVDQWTLGSKTAHGLTLSRGNGRDILFITITEAWIVKTTLDGEVLLEIEAPHQSGDDTAAMPYAPTETAIGPNGDIYVIDGYGSQFIIRDWPDGKSPAVIGKKVSENFLPRENYQGHRDLRYPDAVTWLPRSWPVTKR